MNFKKIVLSTIVFLLIFMISFFGKFYTGLLVEFIGYLAWIVVSLLEEKISLKGNIIILIGCLSFLVFIIFLLLYIRLQN